MSKSQFLLLTLLCMGCGDRLERGRPRNYWSGECISDDGTITTVDLGGFIQDGSDLTAGAYASGEIIAAYLDTLDLSALEEDFRPDEDTITGASYGTYDAKRVTLELIPEELVTRYEVSQLEVPDFAFEPFLEIDADLIHSKKTCEDEINDVPIGYEGDVPWCMVGTCVLPDGSEARFEAWVDRWTPISDALCAIANPAVPMGLWLGWVVLGIRRRH